MKRKDIKKLDLLWSKVIHQRGKCEYCSRMDTRLEAAHIIGRTYRATRWGCMVDGKYDLAGMLLCFREHKQYDEHGPQEQDIKDKCVGEERYRRLSNLAKQSVTKYQEYSVIKKCLEYEL